MKSNSGLNREPVKEASVGETPPAFVPVLTLQHVGSADALSSALFKQRDNNELQPVTSRFSAHCHRVFLTSARCNKGARETCFIHGGFLFPAFFS